jgi:hypothetical protein
LPTPVIRWQALEQRGKRRTIVAVAGQVKSGR